MSQRPTICLIHGHGVDATIWDSIYADLALVYTVLTPDFSRLTTRTTIEGYAGELYSLLQSATVEQVVLVGHSMGGYIALAFAEKYPERVQGLVLFHSTPAADDPARSQVRQQAISELQTEGTVPFIRKQLPKTVAPNYPADKLQLLIDRYSALPAEALAAGVKAIAARPDRTDVVNNAPFPVLFVLGREDQLIPHDKVAQLAESSSQIRVASLEQTGHMGMIEQPEASVETIRAFVDGL